MLRGCPGWGETRSFEGWVGWAEGIDKLFRRVCSCCVQALPGPSKGYSPIAV